MYRAAFTTPTQTSLVVPVFEKLYEVVCNIEGCLLT